jgi:hypothetical protein
MMHQPLAMKIRASAETALLCKMCQQLGSKANAALYMLRLADVTALLNALQIREDTSGLYSCSHSISSNSSSSSSSSSSSNSSSANKSKGAVHVTVRLLHIRHY